MKKILLFFWNKLFDFKTLIVNTFYAAFDFFYKRIIKFPYVATVNETISKIVEDRASISRFGDGEIKLVAGKDISFQECSSFVQSKMIEVLSSNEDGHLIGLPDVFAQHNDMIDTADKYWSEHLHRFRHTWYKYLRKGKIYYNASITRQYFAVKNKSECTKWFKALKGIWNERDVVFIEGEKSRLGIGNDLFDNAKSVKRILGPSKNAFSRYNDLLTAAEKLDKNVLILLALGPCATALAYDLHKCGYQAVDIGHVDIEYEWFLMNAIKRVPVKNKYVNEAEAGKDIGELNDNEYKSQIIAEFL